MNENNIGLETSTKKQKEPLSDYVPGSNHIQCQKKRNGPSRVLHDQSIYS